MNSEFEMMFSLTIYGDITVTTRTFVNNPERYILDS